MKRPGSQRLRLAIVSTPRTGNTWLRALLAHVYGIANEAWLAVPDHQWAAFPDEMLLQIHWGREQEFEEKLRQHGFRVLTLARHPFDVLISILQFSVYNASPVHLGGTGIEQEIWGAMPRSRAFLEFAQGPRARTLLAMSAEWWQQADYLSVRYEDCVADPVGELNKLVAELGPPRAHSVEQAVELCSLNQMRKTSINNHFWQGRPGLWRELLPAAEAAELAASVHEPLAKLGYACDPDPNLTPSQADANWIRYAGATLGETLREGTLGHQTQIRECQDREQVALANCRQAHADAERARADCSALRADVAAALADRDTVQESLVAALNQCDALRIALEDSRRHSAQFAGLSGAAVRLAHAFQRLRNRMPVPARIAKRVVAWTR